MTGIRVYCASKLHRAHWWREWKRELSPSVIDIISTWHDDPNVETLEADHDACERGWRMNRMEILHKAEHLLVFGGRTDALNGTLIEIGMALAMELQIHLVGSYPWGTWTHLPNVCTYSSLHRALCGITGVDMHLPVKEYLRNDPT